MTYILTIFFFFFLSPFEFVIFYSYHLFPYMHTHSTLVVKRLHCHSGLSVSLKQYLRSGAFRWHCCKSSQASCPAPFNTLLWTVV